MTIAREEIFGPVLSIIPYESEEQAIGIANDTLYGLAAYVQSGDILEHARKVARPDARRAGPDQLSRPGTPARPSAATSNPATAANMPSSAWRSFLEVKGVVGYGAA